MHAPPFIPHETSAQSDAASCPQVNVATNERLISIGTGGALLLNSLIGPKRSRPLSFLTGAGLLYRGLTGHCHAYAMLGIDTAQHENEEDERLSEVVSE
ncbi:hypothetical protein AYO47_08445 [Planctomyces sp. SCGC AG-212-M04]|nr:hypothetical protein AYO47_08445 [Planctomyces sp. SCGC AG-212-M04]